MKSFEIKNIKNGDFKLFEELFRHYYKYLVYFSYKYVKEVQTAEDVVHDVFVKIWNNRKNLDFNLNFKSYIITAVKNQSLKSLKKSDKYEKVDIEFVEIADNGRPDDDLIKDEFNKLISEAISELPERRREIFCMHRFDKLTYSEIATVLNLSTKTIETQMGRSIKFLRERLSYLLK